MTMRADVERNTAAGTDAYGGPVAPAFTVLGTFACFVWSRQGRVITDGDKTAVVEDLRAIFPLGTDIQETDEIVSVKDRRGVEIIAGRLRVDAPPQRKHRHLEAALERVN